MKVLLIDTETTGLKRDKDFVISIGSVIFDTKKKEIIDQFYVVLDWTLVTDKIQIEPYITEINGFTIESLKSEGVHPNEAFDMLYDFITKNDIPIFHVLGAFNLPFDYGMLKSNSKSLNHKIYHLLCRESEHSKGIVFFDSCHFDRMFHSGFNEDGTIIRHNMAVVGERYEIEDDSSAHNALNDVRFLSEIFKKQLNEIKEMKRKINKKFEEEMSVSYSMWKYAENQSFYANEVKGIDL